MSKFSSFCFKRRHHKALTGADGYNKEPYHERSSRNGQRQGKNIMVRSPKLTVQIWYSYEIFNFLTRVFLIRDINYLFDQIVVNWLALKLKLFIHAVWWSQMIIRGARDTQSLVLAAFADSSPKASLTIACWKWNKLGC